MWRGRERGKERGREIEGERESDRERQRQRQRERDGERDILKCVCERFCKRAIKVQAWAGLVLKLVCTFCTLKINFEHAHSFVVAVCTRGTSFVKEPEHRASLASEMIAIFGKGSVTRFGNLSQI